MIKNRRILKKNNSLKLNQQVSHERFGLGIILEIEGEGKDKIASINFNGIGIKKLLLRRKGIQINLHLILIS